MKKFLLSLLTMMIVAVAGFAQSSLLATLSHEGTVKTYYGASALKSAYEDATHGDVITLSPGTFLATNISKAITVRGAGMDADSLSSREPTIITGDFNLNIADSISERLIIEGIYHNHKMGFIKINNPTFLKCRFRTIEASSSGLGYSIRNAAFIHCKISSSISTYYGSSVSFLSCVVNCPINSSNDGSVFEFTNSIIMKGNASAFGVYNSSFKNCYIFWNYNSSGSAIDNTNTLFNNASNYSWTFNKCPNSTNKIVQLSSVFKTWTSGNWNDNEKYELTDEAKTKYLGTDGTQIAIYGGNLPFESTPSNPQITRCQVASKSTADGKLSVDITIRASE